MAGPHLKFKSNWRVEEREGYWVCTNGIKELGPVFEARVSAFEVLSNFLEMVPFFDRIPVIPHGTSVPRTKEMVELYSKGELY